MDVKNFVGLLVFGVIGVIVLAAFVPIISETTSATKTFENEGYFYMQKITADDENTYTLEYVYDPDSTKLSYEYNGQAIDTSNWPVSPLNVTLASDGNSWLVRASPNNEYVGMQAVGYGFAFGGHNTWSVTIEFDSGTVTATAINSSDVSATYTTTYTEMWIYSPTPTDYIMKKSNVGAYMHEDSEYVAMGITSVTAWNTGIKIVGNLDDFTATIIYPPNLTTTVTNKEIVKTQTTGYLNLYSLDKLTFTINDGTTTVDATYSYFIVPATVTAEKSVHPDDALSSVIDLLPLIAGIGLMIILVAEFLYTRYL